MLFRSNVFFGPRVSVADNVTIKAYSHIDEAQIGSGCIIGPFARLRPGAKLAADVHVGNFVEIKNAVLDTGVKANHLTYLGDAHVGEGTNVGAGTITCNYDGERKQVTTIQDGAFIGSDSQLIAPVEVGTNAYVGTGTTVRENVPGGALAVSAGRQRTIDDWVAKKGRAKKT